MTPYARASKLAIRRRVDGMRVDLGLPPVQWPELPRDDRHKECPFGIMPAPGDAGAAEREPNGLRNVWSAIQHHLF
jgi:hypothetical protein